MTYVLYSVQSKATEIDKKLKSQGVCDALNELKITYISFRHSPKEFLLKQLHWTQLNNRHVRYERLENVSINILAKKLTTNKINKLRHTLLSLKILAGHFIFLGVKDSKQG